MRRFFLTIALLIFAASGFQPHAQEAVQEPVEIGEAGKAYLRSIRLRRLDTDVAYFDPSAPAPDLKTEQQPKPPEPRTGEDIQWPFALVAGVLLAFIAFLFLRFGGGIAVSLRRDAQNPDRNRTAQRSQPPAWAEKISSLEDILRIKDRKRALVLLAQKVLATTVSANGVLMQRSWTARDALRHVPDTQQHRDTLRDLVLASEHVQFGERDVTEDEFHNFVSGSRQLLGPGTA